MKSPSEGALSRFGEDPPIWGSGFGGGSPPDFEEALQFLNGPPIGEGDRTVF